MALSLYSVIFLANCASEPQKTYSSSSHDSTTPMQHSGELAPLEMPRGLTPEKNTRDAFSLPAATGADAAGSAVFMGAAMLLGTVLHTDSPREDLRGICQYGESNNLAVTSPCIHVTVNLIDANKSIQASAETNENGHFRFYIPKEQFFYVQVLDRKGRMAILNKKSGRGDIVSVLLKP